MSPGKRLERAWRWNDRTERDARFDCESRCPRSALCSKGRTQAVISTDCRAVLPESLNGFHGFITIPTIHVILCTEESSSDGIITEVMMPMEPVEELIESWGGCARGCRESWPGAPGKFKLQAALHPCDRDLRALASQPLSPSRPNKENVACAAPSSSGRDARLVSVSTTPTPA